MQKNKRLVIFGFSGSGKSTMANMISEKYGIKVVHPSGILRWLYEGKNVDVDKTKHNMGFWESTKGIEIFKKRLHEKKPLDLVVDKIILNELKKGNVVIDSWSLPWLAKDCLKVYLYTSLRVRAERVAKRDSIPYLKALKIIRMKDEDTRKLLKKLYGFDIKLDTKVFGKIINTDGLNKEKTYSILCKYLNKQKDWASI
jgi:cytidylate kinase